MITKNKTMEEKWENELAKIYGYVEEWSPKDKRQRQRDLEFRMVKSLLLSELKRQREEIIQKMKDWSETTYYRDVDSFGNGESYASEVLEDLNKFLSLLNKTK